MGSGGRSQRESSPCPSIERHDLRGLIPEPRRRFADPSARDDEIWRDFRQRDEDKGPFEQFGMG